MKNKKSATHTFDYKIGQKIGIWGFGIVGKSAAQFFKDSNPIQVFDNRVLNGSLSSEEQEFLKTHDISVTDDLEKFLEYNDIIIPSPSVRLESHYQKYQNKWWPEFDIFAHYFKKPIIAITGSVGKTSVTKLLSDLLCKGGNNWPMGGNIGIACLDLVGEDPSMLTPRYARFAMHSGRAGKGILVPKNSFSARPSFFS
jgi:UDP-N-acetylmuramoylalanine--D-glutamate ligase